MEGGDNEEPAVPPPSSTNDKVIVPGASGTDRRHPKYEEYVHYDRYQLIEAIEHLRVCYYSNFRMSSYYLCLSCHSPYCCGTVECSGHDIEWNFSCYPHLFF